MAIVSPTGYRSLAQGQTYYVLGRDDHALTLAVFHEQRCEEKSENARRLCVRIFRLSAEDFDSGKQTGEIDLTPVSPFPPWVRDERRVTVLCASNGSDRATALRKKVADRLRAVRHAVRASREVMRGRNIERELNRQARKKRSNAPRFRVWWAAYQIFGSPGLLPATDRCGHWDRKAGTSKLGRPSLVSGRAGFRRDHDMDAKCVDGWRKHRTLGKPLEELYRATIRSEFRCTAMRDSNGKFSYYSPSGDAYPTLDQFRSSLIEQVGLDAVRLAKLGREGLRSISAPLGKFSENVSQINEVVEGDAYVLGDTPVGYDGSEQPPIVVVTLTCGLVGMPTGIGASPDGETSEAYRSALWFSAVGASVASRYFGLDISEEEWPSGGLPGRAIFDRGAGSVEEIGAELRCRELSLSHSGQSKATTEASHPRKTRIEGKPVRRVSGLSPTALFQREVLRYASNANSDDASSRATPRTIADQVLNTPAAHWRYYQRELRDASSPISFAAATRKFLRRVSLPVDAQGVRFEILRYRGDSEGYEKLASRAQRAGVFQVTAYVHPMCVRYIWVDFDGDLLELDARLPVGDTDSNLYMSIPELTAASSALAKLESDRRSQRPAARAHFMDQHPDQRAESPQIQVGRRKPGKARRSAGHKQTKKVLQREV